MVKNYAQLLPDSDPRMRAAGLHQPRAARAAWDANVLPPVGVPQVRGGPSLPDGLSEQMVLYATTRTVYKAHAELTVDYGKQYVRPYASGGHRATPMPWHPPPDVLSTAQRTQACFPHLPGWFSPRQQPTQRPALKVTAAGRIAVCPDDPTVVAAARRAALGASSAQAADAPAAQEAVTATRDATAVAAATSAQPAGAGAGLNASTSAAAAALVLAAELKGRRSAMGDVEGGTTSPRTPPAGSSKKRPRVEAERAGGGTLSGLFAAKRALSS